MNQNTGVQSCAAWHGKGSGKEVAATNVFVSFLGPVLIMLFPFIALLMQLSGSRLPRYVMCKLLHTRGKARFARLPLDPFLSYIFLCRGRNAFSRAAGARSDKESIFNKIFEFSAVFTCYLTYYKPIAKKSCFGAPAGAPWACSVREVGFFIFMNLFYPYN